MAIMLMHNKNLTKHQLENVKYQANSSRRVSFLNCTKVLSFASFFCIAASELNDVIPCSITEQGMYSGHVGNNHNIKNTDGCTLV